MKLHILSNKMYKNVMFMKLLNYALKVARSGRTLNRTPPACELPSSHSTDMAMPLHVELRNN